MCYLSKIPMNGISMPAAWLVSCSLPCLPSCNCHRLLGWPHFRYSGCQAGRGPQLQFVSKRFLVTNHSIWKGKRRRLDTHSGGKNEEEKKLWVRCLGNPLETWWWDCRDHLPNPFLPAWRLGMSACSSTLKGTIVQITYFSRYLAIPMKQIGWTITRRSWFGIEPYGMILSPLLALLCDSGSNLRQGSDCRSFI